MCIQCELSEDGISPCANCDLYMCHKCGINLNFKDENDETTREDDEKMKNHMAVCKKSHSFDVCFTRGGHERYKNDDIKYLLEAGYDFSEDSEDDDDGGDGDDEEDDYEDPPETLIYYAKCITKGLVIIKKETV